MPVAPSDPNSSLIRHQSCENPDARLVCFHHAAGSANAFRLWSVNFPKSLELLAFQMPGREQRSAAAFYPSLESAACEASQALQSLCDRPLFIFGHSLGGALAFEAVRKAEAAGFAHINGLVVAAARPPHVPPRGRQLSNLPEDELIAELSRFEGTPQAVLSERQLLRYFLPRIRSDFGLSEEFVSTQIQPVNCPLLAFAGTKDTIVTKSDMLGWEMGTCATFDLVDVEGGHFFVQDERARIPEKVAAFVEHRLNAGP